jgi:DNA-binding transcriptional regulator YiaG
MPRLLHDMPSYAAEIKKLRVRLSPNAEELKRRKQFSTTRPKGGISQAELAARMGVSRRTVQSWEIGRNVGGATMVLLDRMIAEAKVA